MSYLQPLIARHPGKQFGAVLADDLSPTNRYSVDQISDSYAELALRMVRRA